MRAILSPALLALALSACSADSTGGPSATAAFARDGQTDPTTVVLSIDGTLETTESGMPQPGTPIVVRTLNGTGIATHLGRFTLSGTFTLNLATATGAGTSVYTAANGDQLYVSVTGSAVVGGGFAVVTESVTVTGGTGRFENATGTLTVIRRVTQATGMATGTIEGTVTLPR